METAQREDSNARAPATTTQPTASSMRQASTSVAAMADRNNNKRSCKRALRGQRLERACTHNPTLKCATFRHERAKHPICTPLHTTLHATKPSTAFASAARATPLHPSDTELHELAAPTSASNNTKHCGMCPQKLLPSLKESHATLSTSERVDGSANGHQAEPHSPLRKSAQPRPSAIRVP